MQTSWVDHLGHLCVRGWSLMVKATGTSTLGLVVWTVAIAVASWIAIVIQKHGDLTKSRDARPWQNAVVQSWQTGAYTLGAIFLVGFLAWVVFCCVAIYQDHMGLLEKNNNLTAELQRLKTGSMTMRIKGYITNENQHHDAIQQVWLSVDNSGEPTTLSNWTLTIPTSNGEIKGVHTPGQRALSASLNIPFLDAEFSRPVGIVSDFNGYVTFATPGTDRKQVDALYLDRGSEIVVRATDRLGREVVARKNIRELWDAGHEVRPNTANTK